MSLLDNPGRGGGGIGDIGTVAVPLVAGGVGGGVLPESGILPQTGSSSLSLIVAIAIITFAAMIISRLAMLIMRRFAQRNA